MSRLDVDVAALEDMSPAQLRQRWSEIDDRPMPRVPTLVMKLMVAHRLQERKFGGLPKLVRRELMRLAAEAKDGVGAPTPRTKLSPGARLVREWNGQTILVDVLEGGFRYNDQIWNSLSEIARNVTGTHWSGPRFFGLTGDG